jgi:hypothetical protein
MHQLLVILFAFLALGCCETDHGVAAFRVVNGEDDIEATTKGELLSTT